MNQCLASTGLDLTRREAFKKRTPGEKHLIKHFIVKLHIEARWASDSDCTLSWCDWQKPQPTRTDIQPLITRRERERDYETLRRDFIRQSQRVRSERHRQTDKQKASTTIYDGILPLAGLTQRERMSVALGSYLHTGFLTTHDFHPGNRGWMGLSPSNGTGVDGVKKSQTARYRTDSWDFHTVM